MEAHSIKLEKYKFLQLCTNLHSLSEEMYIIGVCLEIILLAFEKSHCISLSNCGELQSLLLL